MRRSLVIGSLCAACFAVGLVLSPYLAGKAQGQTSASLLHSEAATDLTAEQIRELLVQTSSTENLDRLIRVIDIGPYNISVNVQHRVSPNTGENRGTVHSKVTEIYYVLDGSATLVTGGTMIDPEPGTYSADRITPRGGGGSTGPGFSGTVEPPYVSRRIVAGDVVIMPPMTAHWFSAMDDHIDYLAFRVDLEHVLPAPFISSDLPQ